MMRMKPAQEVVRGAYDLDTKYAAAYGMLGASLEVFYNFDLDKVETLEELKKFFHMTFDKYMEEK